MLRNVILADKRFCKCSEYNIC